MNKKGVALLSAVILLTLISVISILSFNNWYIDYSSKLLSDDYTDAYLTSSFGLKVEAIAGNSLYIKNDNDNLTVKDIKIDGYSCFDNETIYSSGIIEIDVSECISKLKIPNPEILVITDKGVLSSSVYFKHIGIPFYLPCSLDGITKNHGASYNFYISNSTNYNETCAYELRTCNNGSFSGNTSYIYSTCFSVSQDITPDEFLFDYKQNVELNSLIVSDNITITGFDGLIDVTITGDGNPQF